MYIYKEIGSEFWDVPVNVDNIENKVFPESTQWFLSGRSALQVIIKEIKNNTKNCLAVAMPSWCCDSMVKPFVDAGIEVKFYPVYWEAQGLIQEIIYDCDILFLMDYFGYTGEPLNLTDYTGTVIRDVTHSVFSTTYSDADYYFGSLRKWCGVWTGGYVWAQDGHEIPINTDLQVDDCSYVDLRKKAMQDKSDYINGVNSASKSYFNIFNDAEEVLETIGIVQATDRDIEAASVLDVEYIKKQRRKNAEILREAFSEWLIFQDMKDDDCPMFVPILVPDGKRNGLRHHLINNKIYCPVHWPVSEYHTGEYHEREHHVDKIHTDENAIDTRTEYVYANELSLVCDQRYTEEDMKRMVKVINDFMKGA